MSFARTYSRFKPLHAAVAIVLGVTSGFYIFDEPLRQMHEQELARQAAEKAAGGAQEESSK